MSREGKKEIFDYIIEKIKKTPLPFNEEEIMECDKCALHKKCTPLEGVGNKQAYIMIIGKCQSPEEKESGKLFKEVNSKYIKEALSYADIDIKEIYATKIVKCYTNPSRLLNKTYIRICSTEHLLKEIEEIKPKVIITMGNEASKMFGRQFIVNSYFYEKEYDDFYTTRHH